MQNIFAFVSASVMVTSYVEPLWLGEARCALWTITTRTVKELHRLAFWFLYI